MIGGGLYLRDIGNPFGTGLLGLGYLAIPVSVVITLAADRHQCLQLYRPVSNLSLTQS
jgi:hypothetical protein